MTGRAASSSHSSWLWAMVVHCCQVLNLDKKKKEDGIKIGVVTREMIDWQVCIQRLLFSLHAACLPRGLRKCILYDFDQKASNFSHL